MHVDALVNREIEYPMGPTIQSHMCKRVRFRQSDCRKCVDVCPETAITLPFGPELSDACSNCGFCQSVCPTEVFESSQHSDHTVMEALQDKCELIVEHKLYVHCHLAESDNVQSLAVNCIGNMSENALFSMLGFDVRTLMLSTGDCESCKLCQGRALFKQAVATYKGLAKGFSRPALVIKTRIRETRVSETRVSETRVSETSVSETKETEQTESGNRRAFFRSIGADVVSRVTNAASEKEQQIKALLESDEEKCEQKRPSPKREMLKTLLTRQCEANLETSVADGLDYRKMEVDAANCVACGVCVNVCPTGALIKEVNDYELTRTINYSLCTNCGVCAEACPQDVIGFKALFSLNDLLYDTEEVVAKVALNACMICGEIVPVSEGEICTTCQKRQVVPMFM